MLEQKHLNPVQVGSLTKLKEIRESPGDHQVLLVALEGSPSSWGQWAGCWDTWRSHLPNHALLPGRDAAALCFKQHPQPYQQEMRYPNYGSTGEDPGRISQHRKVNKKSNNRPLTLISSVR